MLCTISGLKLEYIDKWPLALSLCVSCCVQVGEVRGESGGGRRAVE